MKVLAAPGLQCPKADKPREYIPDTGEGVEVPDDSAYYRRLIDDGSLVPVLNNPSPQPSPREGRGSKPKEVKDGK